MIRIKVSPRKAFTEHSPYLLGAYGTGDLAEDPNALWADFVRRAEGHELEYYWQGGAAEPRVPLTREQARTLFCAPIDLCFDGDWPAAKAAIAAEDVRRQAAAQLWFPGIPSPYGNESLINHLFTLCRPAPRDVRLDAIEACVWSTEWRESTPMGSRSDHINWYNRAMRYFGPCKGKWRAEHALFAAVWEQKNNVLVAARDYLVWRSRRAERNSAEFLRLAGYYLCNGIGWNTNGGWLRRNADGGVRHRLSLLRAFSEAAERELLNAASRGADGRTDVGNDAWLEEGQELRNSFRPIREGMGVLLDFCAAHGAKELAAAWREYLERPAVQAAIQG